MLRDPGLLQPEPLSLQQATADMCLLRRHSNIQSSSNLVFPSKQKDQAWALPGSLAVYRVVLRGSEEASNLDW